MQSLAESYITFMDKTPLLKNESNVPRCIVCYITVCCFPSLPLSLSPSLSLSLSLPLSSLSLSPSLPFSLSLPLLPSSFSLSPSFPPRSSFLLPLPLHLLLPSPPLSPKLECHISPCEAWPYICQDSLAAVCQPQIQCKSYQFSIVSFEMKYLHA